MPTAFSQNSMVVDEEIEVEEEDLGHAETYAEYMPPKCMLLEFTQRYILSKCHIFNSLV